MGRAQWLSYRRKGRPRGGKTRRYRPHFLGAGIGLVASAHILAAAGGDGMLEIDVNPNPLCDAFQPRWPVMQNGWVDLPDGQGLGFEPDLQQLGPFETTRLIVDKRP